MTFPAVALAPMNTSEKIMARFLIRDLPGEGYLLGDNEYDVNLLYDLAHEAGYQLLELILEPWFVST